MSQFYKKLCGNKCSSDKKNLQRIKGEEAAEKDMEPTVYNTISKYILIKMCCCFKSRKQPAVAIAILSSLVFIAGIVIAAFAIQFAVGSSFFTV